MSLSGIEKWVQKEWSQSGSILSKRFVTLLCEDCLEFVEVEHAVLLDVVAGDHFLDLGARNLLTQLLEGEVQVLLSDKPTIVRVKLLENGP